MGARHASLPIAEVMRMDARERAAHAREHASREALAIIAGLPPIEEARL